MCVFVQAMHILLQKSISAEGNRADMLMLSFVGRFQMLYGTSSMTYNVHVLTHLATSVQKWGPLWTHSCFPFESCNGEVKKLLCGSKGIALQAMRKFMLIKAFPLFCSLYDVSDRVTAQCKQYIGSVKVYGVDNDGIQLLGTQRFLALSEEEQFALTSHGYDIHHHVDSYDRLSKNGCTFQTVHYTRSSARNNKYFRLYDGTVGELHRVILNEGQCLIMYKKLLLCDALEFRDPQSGSLVHHIKRLTGVQDFLEVAPAQLLVCNCVVLELRRHSYCCIFPNHCVL